MSEVTRILSAIEQGDPHAAEQLLPLVASDQPRRPSPVPPENAVSSGVRLSR